MDDRAHVGRRDEGADENGVQGIATNRGEDGGGEEVHGGGLQRGGHELASAGGARRPTGRRGLRGRGEAAVVDEDRTCDGLRGDRVENRSADDGEPGRSHASSLTWSSSLLRCAA